MEFNVLYQHRFCSGVYQITNSVNEIVYIGSTKSFRQRCYTHGSNLRLRKHSSVALQELFNCHGAGVLTFSILELCAPDCLIAREQQHLTSAKANGTTYNLSPTAGSPLGVKRSDETKAKMAKNMLGNTNMLGVKHTDESRAKMSATKKGRMTGEAQIEAMRQHNLTKRVYATGFKQSPEALAKREATRAARRAELGPSYGAKPEDYKIRKSIHMKALHQAKLAANQANQLALL